MIAISGRAPDEGGDARHIRSGGFLLNTGARIPALGLGTWQTGDGDVCKNAVKVALEAGYRHLDCAHLYGNEVEVGKALAEALILQQPQTNSEASSTGSSPSPSPSSLSSSPLMPQLEREHLFVTSKILCSGMAPRRVESAVRDSLRNLNLTYLDLFLMHWPSHGGAGHVGEDAMEPAQPPKDRERLSPRVLELWRAMEQVMDKGLVRAIGVSNFSIAQVEQLLGSGSRTIPAVNQVELHPLWRQDDLVRFCQSKGIHVSAHTPLGVRSESSLDLNDTDPPSNTSSSKIHQDSSSPLGLPLVYRRIHSGYIPLLTMSAVEDIALRLNKTSAQVILRWGLQRGTSVLPCSLHPERIRSNFDVLDWVLAEEDWRKINSMEVQRPLIGGSTSLLRNRPLQAVQETEDDADAHEEDDGDDEDGVDSSAK